MSTETTETAPAQVKKASKLKARDPKTAEPSKPKILLFGKPGIGKTWFALDFPNCYYFDTEGGANLEHYSAKLSAAGGKYLGPEDGTLDFSFLLSQIEALCTEDHGFKTLVVDSISKIFNTAVAVTSEQLGEKDAFGASKKPAVAMMRRLIAWLGRLDMNVLLIAHEKPEWGLNTKGERVEMGATFDAWDKLEYELHLAVHAQKRGNSRVMIVRKSRLLGFPDGETMPLDFLDFAKRYGRDVINKDAAMIVLASTEQVSEIQRLVSVLKVADDEIQKIFTKAGVDSWHELTRDQAEKSISWLKSKLN